MPATPVRPKARPPCHRPLSTGSMMPPPVTTESTSATAAAPHGAADMAAPETDISSRRDSSWSVRVDADIQIPALQAQYSRHIVSRREYHVITHVSPLRIESPLRIGRLDPPVGRETYWQGSNPGKRAAGCTMTTVRMADARPWS